MHRESSRKNGYYSFRDGSTQRICYHEMPVRRTKRSRMSHLQAPQQIPPPPPSSSEPPTSIRRLQKKKKALAPLLPRPLLLLLALLCFWLCFPLLNSGTLPRALIHLRSIYNHECPPTPRTQARSQSPELQPALQELVRRLVEEHVALAIGNNRQGCSGCQRPPADRMADFALESQGASVITSRCSQTYTSASPRLTVFGIPLFDLSRGPRTVIQGSLRHPGECWAFVGSKGTLAVSLSHPVRIRQVTLEHAQRANSPTGEIKSAPRDFEVYGIQMPLQTETFLGNFSYDQFGEPSQTFVLKDPGEEVYQAVELHILTNWGQKEYTCLYRFRVHGHMVSAA